ncbi:MAG TPA: RNA polymerase subunit sigma-70 [Dysgonomonas sp.]|nr:RNA polymerase subunit sigma-70 [Dysgonomonas sp.]
MLLKNLNTIDEQYLWSRFIEGDNNSYEFLYRKYVTELFSYGMRFTKDRELIKDCIHDVFVKIYNNRSNLSNIENVKLYLFISLKNTLFNVFEKDKSLYHVDTVEPVFSVDYPVEDEWLMDDMEEEKKIRISKILEGLTPRQKEVMYYRYVEGFSLQHICEIMDMNYQSVQNLIQRAIKKLQTVFTEKNKKSLKIRMRFRN